MDLPLSYGARERLAAARSSLRRAVRRITGASWERVPDVPPWLDHADALARIAENANPADRPLLEQWVRDGYVVLDGVVDARDIDAMLVRLDGLWDAAAPVPGLTLLDLREAPDAPARNVPHAELLARTPATRAAMRAASHWRVHGFHYFDAAARRLFSNPKLARFAGAVFGRPAHAFAAINFMTGSEQALHQDMAVFHIHPRNFLLGAWIACEDVDTDRGPLVLYPGSHREPPFPGFTDYPQTNLRTADPALFERYQAWVDGLATRHPRHEFLARKGQVLVWHGMLIHGGAPVRRAGSTRKSMVLHYTVRRADRTAEIEGPFNW